MSQTSYAVNMEAGKEGLLFDLGVKDAISCVNPAVEMPFGKLAVVNGTEGQCKLPELAADITTAKNVLGIVLASQEMEQLSSGDPRYVVQSVLPVLRKGRVWVKVEEAVAEGSDVYVRYAAGGNGIGSFGDTAGTSERALLAGARYLKGAAANGLAVVEISLP